MLTSAGVMSNDYAEFRKTKVLSVSLAHEYIFDALAAFFAADSSTIDGTEYISSEDIEPQQRDYSDRMFVKIDVQERTQANQINTNG